jgi:replicative DNA helicase
MQGRQVNISELSLDTGLPANVDCERTILGAVLLDNESFFDDSMELSSEDFSLDSHRRIFLRMTEIMMGMVEGIHHVDIVTLANYMASIKVSESMNEIESVGGVSYLASLTEGLPRRPVIDEYVHICKDKALLRKLMLICSAGIARAADQGETALDVLGAVQSQLADVSGEGAGQAVRIGSITAAIEEKVNRNRLISDERTALEMTWGLDGLDKATHGLFSGEFSVIGGESGGAKTSYGVQLTIANAREGIPVIWFSMEMAKEALTSRFYPSMSEILTNNHMRDSRLMNLHTHVPEMRRISEELSRLPIDIDETSPMRIDKLKGRIKMMVRKWKKETGAKKILVILDYLQLIRGMPKISSQEQFSNILYTLRDIPKEEPEIHLLTLSQYSQGDKFMKKAAGRTKDSLYGGSVIHHAAQNVFMISIESPEKRDKNDLLDVEIKIAKQREGAREKVNCHFDRDHLRFCYPQKAMM